MSVVIDPTKDQSEADAEIQRRLANEQCRYYVPNGRLDALIQAVGKRFEPGSKRIYICILRAGNGIGKSCFAANVASYLSDSYPNLYFDQAPYLRKFQRPNRGRILTTVNAAKNNYDGEFSKWLRRGQYKTVREGKHFNNKYRFGGGSEFDIFTFDQAFDQGESITLNWAITDEPMSKSHWKPLKARFRFGGIIFMLFTGTAGAGWIKNEFETVERLGDDVLMMQGSSEDNCITHGVRGMMAHETLEDLWRDYDDDDMTVRRDGGYAEQASITYPTYRDDTTGHVLAEMPPYYAECWEKGLYTLYQIIDPHHRKPWAIEWRAAFPNGVDIAVSEWPDESMRPFHKMKSWHWGYDSYAKLTSETEKSLGVGKPAHMTIMDPNYGPAAVMSKEKTTSDGAEFVAAYRALTGRFRRIIFPSDAVQPGHLLVKAALGNPARGVTPNTYWMDYCRNGRFGMLNYGIKEKKNESDGISEVPELQFKDFPDLRRYFATAKARYIELTEELPKNMVYSRPRKGRYT